MDDRNRATIVVFLLCVVAGIPAHVHTLDMCASCHANATCNDKLDNSGKVCQCKYGFVGNGRTICVDKDECHTDRICGPHTTCHNTLGSYYCTCMSGYSPSNNMPVFIPNDGTSCQDIDECRITGLCGEGGQCRNLVGSFECSCQLGYQVQNGAEPFHPHRDKASCKVVDCGQPASVEDTVLLSVTGTTYSSVAMFVCDEGFVWRSGGNSSQCGADGLWRGPTMICDEIFCGAPPVLPHTGQVWNGSSTPASTVTYYCEIGFYHSEGNNISLCKTNGYWTKPNISCKEVDCGVPPSIPHSIMLWDNTSTVGSQVVYQCNSGYHSVGEGNVSVCTAGGEWEGASPLCQEINCHAPVFKPHTGILWDGTSHVGSGVYYQCEEGYYTRSLRNYSVCGENGLWEDIDLWCEEISCGPPLTLPQTNLLWDGTSRPGSVVLYECTDGFYQESGNNISTCLQSGQWWKVSVKCKAKCGRIPLLAKSEVVWHNRSVVIHRCVEGYHSWRGSNRSVCGSSGRWQRASLRCTEIKPAVNHLYILNEKCLRWRAEKYQEDTEVYKVTYTGSRDYQRSFHETRKQFLSTKAEQLELCLNLLPLTNYSISITAVTARFTATITANTSLPVPPAPVVSYREFDTPVPTLQLQRSHDTLEPISLYQVFVLPVEGIMMFDCFTPASSDPSSKIKSEYISAQIAVRHVGAEMNFTVGDGLCYGGFFNAPLENGRNYYIILRAVSQWKSARKSSCVLWAKVRGSSYILRVWSLSAAALIGVVVLVILAGYSFTWCFQRT
ncbi:sushi domain-containing protein 1 isoform X1 [Centropristis striata]|uniref:sushi domain-containing protein 1 isoform X1 n=1 Tax=Centropristis striata TaxID=184440 RepID=UPI0027DEF34E|nr:sushi domain-containing protein 1 isoform X1 [Centropristis striata]